MTNYEVIKTLQNIAKHLARINPEIQLDVIDENTIIFKGIRITPNQLIVMLENGISERKNKKELPIMKKITKAQSTQLKKGTTLTTYDGDTIELLTDYSDFHGGYEYVNIEFDEDGNEHRAPYTGYITAQEITHYYEG